ncbi:MAG TPA: XkdF-like putative serine protease domain-containing protein [Vicinamibacterales bacterium]|nr:XkdF-like putative serine protease domain-containing protein [Vicinamibacterales bacterium]
MNAGQVIEQDIPVHFSVRIAKVDKEKREVEGICTQEVVDVHGEVVDHESMKAVLLEWPGNIREMHQPIAVGKAVRVESDDAAKATILRARISKGAPDTWAKVEDGTLSMYSIGGTGKRVISKKADGSEEKRIFLNKLHEISLVDSGACPTARFEVVKMVDGHPTDVQPEDVEKGDEACADCQKAKADCTCSADKAAQPRVLVVPAQFAELLAKLADAPRALEVLKAAEPKLTAPLPEVPAGSVEKRSYPTPYNIEQTLGAIALLERILAEEWWKARDAESADEDATTDKAQLQVLRTAIELVIAYLLSEFNAQFADFDAEAAGVSIENAAITRRAALVEQAAFALPIVFQKLDHTGQLWIAKAGARHSKADTQMIQAMHDTAVTLGATDCAKCVESATKRADGTPATPVQQAAGLDTEAVQAIVKAAVDQALQAHKATSDEAMRAQKAASDAAIAELQARVERLSNEPAPGGPKARATGTEGTPVHKSIGNTGLADFAGVDPAAVEAFAQQLAKDAKTQEERDRIAENLLKFHHTTGAGAVVMRQSESRRPS